MKPVDLIFSLTPGLIQNQINIGRKILIQSKTGSYKISKLDENVRKTNFEIRNIIF